MHHQAPRHWLCVSLKNHAANHHENKVVAIEPKVMEQLLAYARMVWPTVQHLPADDTEGGAE